MFAVAQGLPGSLPWGVLLTFLNDFLSQHKGMTIAEATLVRCCCPGILTRNTACLAVTAALQGCCCAQLMLCTPQFAESLWRSLGTACLL